MRKTDQGNLLWGVSLVCLRFRMRFGGEGVKKIKIALGVGILALVGVFCWLYGSTLFLMINWDMKIGISDVVYKKEQEKKRYVVGKVPFYEEVLIKDTLYKQEVSGTWEEDIREELAGIKTEGREYPPFEEIDYSTRKTEGLSYIYVLYDSDTSMAYILEGID